MALEGNQIEQRSARISGDDSLRFLLNRVAVLSRHFTNSESVRYKFSLYQNACIKLGTWCISNKTRAVKRNWALCTQQLRRKKSTELGTP